MREFMTKMSDYFNEWREDPDREENRLPVAVIGVVVIAVILLLLLLLWWGHGVQEKKKAEADVKARQLQEAQALDAKDQEVRKLEEELEAQGLVAATYEEKMKEYMSQNSGEELRQEYLENTNTLTEKVEELQTVLEQVQKEITKVISGYRTGDTVVTEKLTVLETEVKSVIENMKNLDSRLTDLSNAIQVIDREKIPQIQTQINEIRHSAAQMREDVSSIRERIKALEKEDEKLWAELSKVEKALRDAIDKNMDEIDKRLGDLGKDMKTLEKELRKAFNEALKEAEEKSRQRTDKIDEDLDGLGKDVKALETELRKAFNDALKEAEEKSKQRTEEMSREISKEIDDKVNALSSESLSYRYEKKTNTLYLMPNQKNADKEGSQ